MAKKRSSPKITRRAAVTMLGAGAVIGGVRGKSEAETLAQGPPCATPASVREFDIVVAGKTRLAMLADTCCEESRTAVLAGTVGGPRPTQTTRTHLKLLTDTLARETLDEYCFMIWGLDRTQVNTLYAMVPERLLLKARATKK
jgi:hypothetical protein